MISLIHSNTNCELTDALLSLIRDYSSERYLEVLQTNNIHFIHRFQNKFCEEIVDGCGSLCENFRLKKKTQYGYHRDIFWSN